MKQNSITIALSGDNNYSKYMAVLIQNLIDVSPDYDQINVLILDVDIASENKQKLLNSFNEKENIHIHMVSVRDRFHDELDTLKNYRHNEKKNNISIGAYALFFIAEAFPEFDKAMYIDVDVIITQNLKAAYDTDVEGKYGAAVRMLTHAQLGSLKTSRSGKSFKQNFQDVFHKSANNYFNTGVQLFNLKVMREEKVKDQLVKTLSNIPLDVFHKEVDYHNQDIFNAVFADKINFLPLRYNCQLKNLKKIRFNFSRLGLDFSEFKSEFEKPAIIHYSGGRKPWNDKSLYAAELWWQSAQKTRFYDDINDKYQHNLRKRLKTLKGFLRYFFDFRPEKAQLYLKLFGVTLIRKQASNL